MTWIIAIVTLANLVVGWFTGKNRLIAQLSEMEAKDAKLQAQMDAAVRDRDHLRVTRLQDARTELAHRYARTRRVLRLMGVRGL